MMNNIRSFLHGSLRLGGLPYFLGGELLYFYVVDTEGEFTYSASSHADHDVLRTQHEANKLLAISLKKLLLKNGDNIIGIVN